jgi:hypothetical protein
MAKQADKLKEEVARMIATSTDASHQEKRSDSSSLQERCFTTKIVYFVKLSKCETGFTIVFLSSRW